MNKSEYDKYYKKGGTYVIPVELFNELLDELEELKKNQRLTQEKRNHLHLELDEMVESLQNQLQQKDKEIERLNNIINELEEYTQDLLENGTWSKCGAYKILNKLQELKESNK